MNNLLQPRPQVRTENECLEMWSDAYPCLCSWPAHSQVNFSRGSRKSSSMKRSINSSLSSENQNVSRRLDYEDKDGELNFLFYAGLSSPYLSCFSYLLNDDTCVCCIQFFLSMCVLGVVAVENSDILLNSKEAHISGKISTQATIFCVLFWYPTIY